MKKPMILLTALLAAVLCFGCSNSTGSDTAQISLSNTEITVDGQSISQDESLAVYLTSEIAVHDDVSEELQDTANKIINITRAGTYQLSGEISDAQVRINAPEQEIKLIFANVNISCRTAPAILIEDAADPKQAGEAGVTITLAEDAVNIINGSHLAKYTDENGNEVKNDGAVSSNVSLLIDGNGELQVNGDKEGIESKLHLTVNGGTMQVVSQDDAINASEDGQSVITINAGIINCAIQGGEEGDGIDSNGSICINGGFVVAQAHSSSGDSGLDADEGIVINGGTVCATGNMYEEISADSAQQYVQFYFAQTQKGGEPLVITDTDGNYILAYTPLNDFSILEFSSSALSDGATYYLYSGGTLTGTVSNGIYTQVDSYTGGTQLDHRGAMTSAGRGGRPDGEWPDEMKNKDDRLPPASGERPQNNDQRAERPTDGIKPAGQPPQKSGSGADLAAEQSAEFVISSDSRVFQGIAAWAE